MPSIERSTPSATGGPFAPTSKSSSHSDGGEMRRGLPEKRQRDVWSTRLAAIRATSRVGFEPLSELAAVLVEKALRFLLHRGLDAKSLVADADGGITIYFVGDGRIGLTITNDGEHVGSIEYAGTRDDVWPVRCDERGLEEFANRVRS